MKSDTSLRSPATEMPGFASCFGCCA
jgi:hypothetical protein